MTEKKNNNHKTGRGKVKEHHQERGGEQEIEDDES